MTEAQQFILGLGVGWTILGLIILLVLYIDVWTHSFLSFDDDFCTLMSLLFFPSAIIIWSLVGIYYLFNWVRKKSIKVTLLVVNCNRNKLILINK